MDKDKAQQSLETIYEHWKRNFRNPLKIPLADCSPPLLLKMTNEYCEAAIKIAVYAKETQGYEWSQKSTEGYPKDRWPGERWPYEEICNLDDFLNYKEAVKALCWAYGEFEFAKYESKNRNSPFWRAFRQISEWPNVGLMWSDIVRVDYRGKSVCNAPKELRDLIFENQMNLLQREIEVLDCDICLFFTGPDYDELIKSTFPGFEQQQLDKKIPARELAKISHPSLPALTFRTYHPQHLQYQYKKKWQYIDIIKSHALGY